MAQAGVAQLQVVEKGMAEEMQGAAMGKPAEAAHGTALLTIPR